MDTVFPVSWETGSKADQGPLQTLRPELKDLSANRAVAAPSGLAPHCLRCKYQRFLKDATVRCLTLASEVVVWEVFSFFFYPTTSSSDILAVPATRGQVTHLYLGQGGPIRQS